MLTYLHLLYKCPGLKSKDFKSQEKRERKIDKSVGMHAVVGRLLVIFQFIIIESYDSSEIHDIKQFQK